MAEVAGLTDKGFSTLSLNDIRDRMQDRARMLFKDLLANPDDEVDVSPDSMIGRLIDLTSPEYASMWEALEDVHASKNPSSAEGEALDEVCAYLRVVRFKARKSRVQLLVGGEIGSGVTKGSVVEDKASKTRWVIDNGVTFNKDIASCISLDVGVFAEGDSLTVKAIHSGGEDVFTHLVTSGDDKDSIIQSLITLINTPPFSDRYVASYIAGDFKITLVNLNEFVSWDTVGDIYIVKSRKTVFATAEEVGRVDSKVGSISNILSTQYGWETVYNPLPVELGRLRERDSELRARFQSTKELLSAGYADSLYSRIKSLDGVLQVIVEENYEDVVDSNGVPPHSFEVIVRGGDDQDIANIIARTRPIGIRPHGNIEVVVEGIAGGVKIQKFSRPNNKNIFVKVDYMASNKVAEDVEEQIKTLLVAHIRDTYNIGASVNLSPMFVPLNSIPNMIYPNVQIGDSVGSLGYVPIPLLYNEIPVLLPENITINKIE